MAAWLKALKSLYKEPMARGQTEDIIEELSGDKTDRGCALLAASQVESILRALVKSRMVVLTKAQEEQLFERDAPLSSFSKLIRIAYAFGLIDQEVRQNLDYIREIRNVFAHTTGHINFNTPEVAHVCGLLTQKEIVWKHIPLTEGEAWRRRHPRIQYIAALALILMVFNYYVLHPEQKNPVTYSFLRPSPHKHA